MSNTPEEQAVLAQIAAAQANGEDVFGDNEELVREGATANTATAENTDQATQDDGAAADGEQPPAGADEPQAVQGDGAVAEQAAADLDQAALADLAADPLGLKQPQRFEVQAPANLKEERTKLLGERAAAMKQLMDGELSAEEYAAVDIRIADSLDTLTREQVRAETLAEVNRQNDASYNAKVIQNIINQAKGEVDYANDTAAQQSFDTALRFVSAEPGAEKRDFAELAADAHAIVAARRGVVAQQQGTSTKAPVKAAPDRRPEGGAPVTLRNIPAAASSNTGGGVAEQLSRLSGQDYEQAYARLSPAQKAALLDE